MERGQYPAAHLLTHDEARRIAANIAKLRKLLRGPRRFSEACEVAARTFTTVRATSAYTPMPEVSPQRTIWRHGPQKTHAPQQISLIRSPRRRGR